MTPHRRRTIDLLVLTLSLAVGPMAAGAEEAASAPTAASPSDATPAFDDALRASRSALVISGTGWSGPGAAVLTQAIAAARFVLLGEDHVTREIPQFAQAVCDILRPDAYAVEASPDAAAFVDALLRSPERVARTAERGRRHPSNMVFLDVREESDLAAHCAAASRTADFHLWGLDQAFFGAGGTLLASMAERPGGPRARAAIARAQAVERDAAAAALASAKPTDAFLAGATDADIAALRDGIARDGSARARDLLVELTTSRDIFRRGDAESNHQWALLMKRHFLARYLPLKARMPDARVLVKLGDVHIQKGFNGLAQRDIGNFIAELADGEGTQSLHLFVYGARGVHGLFGGYGRPFRHEPFVMDEDPDNAWLTPAVDKMLPQNASVTTATVFDLRRLRFRGIDLPPAWRQLVDATDLFVLLPEISPASQIE